MKKLNYDRITTTIEREWLAEIIAGTKKIEYRKVKPYWTKRFAKVSVPFELRLLNGMNPPVPEVTVLIHRITKDRRAVVNLPRKEKDLDRIEHPLYTPYTAFTGRDHGSESQVSHSRGVGRGFLLAGQDDRYS